MGMPLMFTYRMLPIPFYQFLFLGLRYCYWWTSTLLYGTRFEIIWEHGKRWARTFSQYIIIRNGIWLSSSETSRKQAIFPSTCWSIPSTSRFSRRVLRHITLRLGNFSFRLDLGAYEVSFGVWWAEVLSPLSFYNLNPISEISCLIITTFSFRKLN